MSLNPFKRFQGLLHREAKQVATVSQVNSDGTLKVDVFGGGSVIVTGDGYLVGVKVFIQSGRVVSPAPTLTPVDIEV
jgi:hypothetical protein